MKTDNRDAGWLCGQTKSYRTADDSRRGHSSARRVSADFSGSRLATLTLVTVCDHLSGFVRSKVDLVMQTHTQELNKKEKKRDIFCAVSDTFWVFARHSSIALGSDWA